ncbi:oxidoreductase, aldo/keto reductase family protein, partial [gut metagenome]
GGPCYNSDQDYIIAQVEQSIKNLHCEYLDILLLHRPDPLMDPCAVAQAFNELHDRKLVRYFGVSNFPAAKMRLLQKFVDQKLMINQIQFSAVHALAIDEGVFFNMMDDHAPSRADQILDYALEHDLCLQAWCPLQASWQDGSYLDHPKYPKLNAVLEKLATKYHVTKSAIGVAWILRLPQQWQV